MEKKADFPLSHSGPLPQPGWPPGMKVITLLQREGAVRSDSVGHKVTTLTKHTGRTVFQLDLIIKAGGSRVWHTGYFAAICVRWGGPKIPE